MAGPIESQDPEPRGGQAVSERQHDVGLIAAGAVEQHHDGPLDPNRLTLGIVQPCCIADVDESTPGRITPVQHRGLPLRVGPSAEYQERYPDRDAEA